MWKCRWHTWYWRSEWITTWNCLHFQEDGNLLTFTCRELDAQSLLTYSGWGTWAALFSCICLEGTWRSRLWLSASPRRSGWGSCRCELSDSNPWGPAPWLHLGGEKKTQMPVWLIPSPCESPSLMQSQRWRSLPWDKHLFSPGVGFFLILYWWWPSSINSSLNLDQKAALQL